MEDADLLQSNGDDEVMVRQTDGTFKKMKMSELSAVSVARKQASPLVQAPPAVPAASSTRTVASVAVPVELPTPPAFQPVARPPATIQPAPVVPVAKSAPLVAPPSSPPVPISIVSVAPSAASTAIDFENQAGALVGRLAADVPEDLKPRVKMLLVSFMKGIRQEYAVRERLLQSVESGGLGWSADKADVFVKQIKALSGASCLPDEAPASPSGIKKETRQSKDSAVSVPEKTPAAVSVAPNLLPEIEPEMHVSKASEAPPQPRVSAQSQTQSARPAPPSKPAHAPSVAIPRSPQPPLGSIPPLKEQPFSKLPQKQQFVPPVPRTSDGIRVSAPPVLKIIEEKGEKPRVVPHEGAIAPQKQPPHIAIPQTPSGKADVKDIAYKPRLIGPIDELRTLTLVDFRRLSRDPQVAVDKIHAKVELLGEESFEKKVKGILAWRASEVNQLYTALLNESIKTGVPIKEILAARAARKEQALAETEFRAIMNLNKQLRF